MGLLLGSLLRVVLGGTEVRLGTSTRPLWMLYEVEDALHQGAPMPP